MVLLCVAEDRFIAGRQPVPIPNAECPQIDPAGAPVESHPVLRVRQFDKQLGVVLKPPGTFPVMFALSPDTAVPAQ